MTINPRPNKGNIATKHALERVALRLRITQRGAKRQILVAYWNGTTVFDCPPKIREYLQRKEHNDVFALLYENVIYLFSGHTLKCITAYPFPGSLSKLYIGKDRIHDFKRYCEDKKEEDYAYEEDFYDYDEDFYEAA